METSLVNMAEDVGGFSGLDLAKIPENAPLEHFLNTSFIFFYVLNK
jgi:hypothetical protein